MPNITEEMIKKALESLGKKRKERSDKHEKISQELIVNGTYEELKDDIDTNAIIDKIRNEIVSIIDSERDKLKKEGQETYKKLLSGYMSEYKQCVDDYLQEKDILALDVKLRKATDAWNKSVIRAKKRYNYNIFLSFYEALKR